MEMTTELVSLLFPLFNFPLCTGVWTARFTAQGHKFPPIGFSFPPKEKGRCRHISHHSDLPVVVVLHKQIQSWQKFMILPRLHTWTSATTYAFRESSTYLVSNRGFRENTILSGTPTL